MLQEAAYIDGAGRLKLLIRIIFPRSFPAPAGISLFLIMGYRNAIYSKTESETVADLSVFRYNNSGDRG